MISEISSLCASDVTDSVMVLTFNGAIAEPENLLALLIGYEKEPRYDGSPYQIWCREWAREAFRILRPGAHLLAFGGTRTYHRLVCAIEDAGFEIRDSVGVAWMYGSGFPKSLDVAKAIDRSLGTEDERTFRSENPANRPGNAGTGVLGETAETSTGWRKPVRPDKTNPASEEAAEWEGWGTALKPAWEPVVLARKPLSEPTVAANVLKWGTGALNIDACRIPGVAQKPGGGIHPDRGPFNLGTAPLVPPPEPNPLGRWPANVLLCHDERCTLRGTKRVASTRAHRVFSRKDGPEGWGNITQKSGEVVNYGDENGEEEVEDWSCVKFCPIRILDEQSGTSVSAGGRNTGVHRIAGDGMRRGLNDPSPTGYGDEGGASRFFYCAKPSGSERGEFNGHPTVKPLGLLSYLLRLVTPPGGRVLDPFCGSGTTNLAAMRLNMESVGIDLSEEYVGWGRRRCAGALDAFDATGLTPATGEKA